MTHFFLKTAALILGSMLLALLGAGPAPVAAEAGPPGIVEQRTGTVNVLVPLINLQDDLDQARSREWVETEQSEDRHIVGNFRSPFERFSDFPNPECHLS